MARGWVQVGGERFELAHAYAFWVEDAEAGKRRVLLLLTDRPIDATTTGLALNPAEAARRELQANGGALVVVPIDEQGREQGFAFWQAASGTGFETTGAGSFSLTRKPAERLAGSWRLAAGEAGPDREFLLEFDAAVSDLPVRGKRLPEAGGEPGAAYLAYAEALRMGDAATLRRLMGERARETLPESADPATEQVILSWLRSDRPVMPVVRSALLRDETAILWVEGADEEGRLLSGRVLMAKTRAGWSEVEADLASR